MAKRAKRIAEEDILAALGEEAPGEKKPEQPLYRIFQDSRIPISRAVGPAWKRKVDAAKKAYTIVRDAWEEAFRYYNHNQIKDQLSSKGSFRRGDGTENVVYSNVNTMVQATYSKNPDISCSTVDPDDQPFCDLLQALLNVLFKRKSAPGLNLKPRAKRATMLAELTNMGILKLDFVAKEEGREGAMVEMEKLTDELAKADKEQIKEIYGRLQALEQQIELREPSGFNLSVVLPHDLTVDPYCECDDLSDANWTAEDTFLPTEYLNERFTEKDKDGNRVLTYKPTHKVALKPDEGDAGETAGPDIVELASGTEVESYTDEERLGYLYTYMTKVTWVWDKVTRQVYLFLHDDFTWPIWVWNDPFNLSRFFPYFLIQYTTPTSGIAMPGPVSYYLDQQDEINEINRRVAQIRSSVFNFFIYNSEKMNKDDVEKFVDYLTGKRTEGKKVIGAKWDGDGKLADVFSHVGVPDTNAQAFFDKTPAMTTIDRIAASSDALRGTQFKANTTEDAVQAYVDATRMKVGAKIDVIEDTIADLALSVAEIAVQFLDKTDVENLLGKGKAAKWEPMDVATFDAMYSVEIVSGSIEKPTGVYKKKEAVEVAQAIGQFSKLAPVTTLKIILRVLSAAFTEVVIKKEDWEAIDAEMAKNMQAQEQGGGGGDLREQLLNAPPEIKAKALQMAEQGVDPQEILAFIQNQQGTQANGKETTEQ